MTKQEFIASYTAKMNTVPMGSRARAAFRAPDPAMVAKNAESAWTEYSAPNNVIARKLMARGPAVREWLGNNGARRIYLSVTDGGGYAHSFYFDARSGEFKFDGGAAVPAELSSIATGE